MRESTFLKENRAKWERFERLVHDRDADADQLGELFVEVTTDLSYARTFYPESETTRYLNGLATDVHRAIYHNRREERSRLVTFWTDELPGVMATAQRELAVALAVFLVAVGVGAVSAAGDAGYVRLILGDAYVNMTLENVAAGDPMAVYAQSKEVDMFLTLTFNNVRVAFLAFAAGLLFSVGTALVLFQNGVMIGAFHYLFHQHDLLAQSLLTVYIHGAFEISAIVIAGCAGLVLGNGLLFPGTYTRSESFVRAARRGVKIVVGLVPVFVAAGFLEGFVTRHTTMPVWLSLLIIVGSLSLVAWYFVIYPRQLARAELNPRATLTTSDESG